MALSLDKISGKLLDLLVSSFSFKTTLSNPSHSEGAVFWDQNEHTLSIYNDDSEVTHQLGYEILIRVKNETGIDITSGDVVYISGTESSGEQRPLVDLADARDPVKSLVIGVATSTISNQGHGYVCRLGAVNQVDTSGFSAGATLYLSDTDPGKLTDALPSAGNGVVRVAAVAKMGSLDGKIEVGPITLIPQLNIQQKLFCYMSGNSTLTSINTVNVDEKIAGTYTEKVGGSDWVHSNGRFTYSGASGRLVKVSLAVSATAVANNKVWKIGIRYFNGTTTSFQVSSEMSRKIGSGVDAGSWSTFDFFTINPGDWFEPGVINTTDDTDFTGVDVKFGIEG